MFANYAVWLLRQLKQMFELSPYLNLSIKDEFLISKPFKIFKIKSKSKTRAISLSPIFQQRLFIITFSIINLPKFLHCKSASQGNSRESLVRVGHSSSGSSSIVSAQNIHKNQVGSNEWVALENFEKLPTRPTTFKPRFEEIMSPPGGAKNKNQTDQQLSDKVDFTVSTSARDTGSIEPLYVASSNYSIYQFSPPVGTEPVVEPIVPPSPLPSFVFSLQHEQQDQLQSVELINSSSSSSNNNSDQQEQVRHLIKLPAGSKHPINQRQQLGLRENSKIQFAHPSVSGQASNSTHERQNHQHHLAERWQPISQHQRRERSRDSDNSKQSLGRLASQHLHAHPHDHHHDLLRGHSLARPSEEPMIVISSSSSSSRHPDLQSSQSSQPSSIQAASSDAQSALIFGTAPSARDDIVSQQNYDSLMSRDLLQQQQQPEQAFRPSQWPDLTLESVHTPNIQMTSNPLMTQYLYQLLTNSNQQNYQKQQANALLNNMHHNHMAMTAGPTQSSAQHFAATNSNLAIAQPMASSFKDSKDFYFLRSPDKALPRAFKSHYFDVPNETGNGLALSSYSPALYAPNLLHPSPSAISDVGASIVSPHTGAANNNGDMLAGLTQDQLLSLVHQLGGPINFNGKQYLLGPASGQTFHQAHTSAQLQPFNPLNLQDPIMAFLFDNIFKGVLNATSQQLPNTMASNQGPLETPSPSLQSLQQQQLQFSSASHDIPANSTGQASLLIDNPSRISTSTNHLHWQPQVYSSNQQHGPTGSMAAGDQPAALYSQGSLMNPVYAPSPALKKLKKKRKKAYVARAPVLRVYKRPKQHFNEILNSSTTDLLQSSAMLHKFKQPWLLHDEEDDDDGDDGETEINLRFFNNFSRMGGTLGGIARNAAPATFIISLAFLILSNISLAATVIVHGISSFLRNMSPQTNQANGSSPHKFSGRLAKILSHEMSTTARSNASNTRHGAIIALSTSTTTERPHTVVSSRTLTKPKLDRMIKSLSMAWL